MTGMTAFFAGRIFDGEIWREDSALLLRGDTVDGILARGDIPADTEIVDTGAAMLVPGFVDIQVNGGGGTLLNNEPTLAGIETICRAHAPFGTTALLPTLITDLPDVTAAAIEAGVEAVRRKVPGFAGLHLEGPHLSIARKGTHDPQLIRPMTDRDLEALIAAKRELPTLLSTIAPESVSSQQVAALAAAGVIVSLGHTDTDYATAIAYVDAGATLATHLFNAMSQLGNREPGVVGAVLDDGRLSAGLIADGFHVDPASIGVAVRAKRGPGRIALVTDAMATIGTTMTSFPLNGRTIYRKDGRLTLADGTLAGADLDMISAVRFMHERIGVELDEALRMAALYPALAIGRSDRLGHLSKGAAASFVALSARLNVSGVWIEGQKVA